MLQMLTFPQNILNIIKISKMTNQELQKVYKGLNSISKVGLKAEFTATEEY